MSRAYTPRAEFVKAASEGKATGDVVLRKQFVSDIKATAAVDGSKMRQFIVSTAAADRDNDCVSVAGWKLDNYKKNPVVLFAHDYSSLPIGKCTNIHTSKGALVAEMEFADHDMAKTVLNLVDGGFLNATSVGFRPLKYAMNEERRGMDFSEQELLEFSIVPVPANPEALIVARELMGDVALMKAWATQVLDVLKDAPVADGDADDDEKGKKPKKPVPDGNEDPQVGQDHKPNDSNLTKKPEKPADEDADDDEDDDDGKKPFTFPPKKFAQLVADAVLAALKAAEIIDEPVVEKRGRVLSAKNETRVRAAHQHLEECLKSLPDYSGGGDDGGETDGLELAETKEIVVDPNEIVIDLVEVERKAENLSDMRDVLRAALKDSVHQAVAEIVKTETAATLNRLRGRLD
jgi:HK97 family phage prohead protease